MPNSFLRQSPLAHLHLEARHPLAGALPDAGVTVSEQAHRTQFVVRGQSADPAFVQAVKKALGLALPTSACTSVTSQKGVEMMWMGPDEWLIVAPSDDAKDYQKQLHGTLKGLHVALVDVTESRTVIRLSGQCARTVLDKGCPIDLHPSSFGPGQVVNTLMARAHIILHQIKDDENTQSPCYEIYVHRSFAEYLWSWIEDASREFGLKINS